MRPRPTENSRIVNPKFRRHQLEEMVNAGLSSLITKGIMNFFEAFHINADFLRGPPVAGLKIYILRKDWGL